jgi:hypothetical protein
MPDLKTTYTTFNVLDYKNEQVLSSYSLEQTPFKFVPDLDLFANKDVVWSFGDGTISKSITATKYYTFPGVYTVNLLVYDCQNNALISSYSQNVEIKDYIPYTLKFTNLSSNKGYLELKESVIHGPWVLNATYPWHQPITDIVYDVSGSSSLNYFSVNSNKFAHLQKTYSIFDSTYNYAIANTQYYEVPKITISNPVKLYAKISGNSIVLCSENDNGSFFVGTSAEKAVYYKDDSVGNTAISFKFNSDFTNIDGKTVNYVNNLGVMLSANIIQNNDASRLTITSNGLDGEKTAITSFDIYHTKFTSSEIPFVVKIKDSQFHSLKNFNPIELNNLAISVLSAEYLTTESGDILLTESNIPIIAGATPINSSYFTVSSLNYTIDDIDHNGSFRGYVKFNSLSTTLTDVFLSCGAVLQNNYLSSFNLATESTLFNVLPRSLYDIYKVNENFNAAETLNNLAFQERIKDNPVLFNDFLAAIFGSDEYDHDSIGVKTYEKIANFIQNNTDIDTKNIRALISDINLVDNEELVFNRTPIKYPENIERIANLASISLNKLVGTTNKFKQNFNSRGDTQKDKYGKNIGNQIDTLNYVITAGAPIVALEKFSNTYTLLNTYQPLCAGSGSRFTLSGYNSNWGWPLVLPTQFTPLDFEKYYIFFEYIDVNDGTIIDNVIDFTNPNTTISSDSPTSEYLFGNSGIFNTMFLDSLYQSLSI